MGLFDETQQTKTTLPDFFMKMEDKDYFAHPAISNSDLSKFRKEGPKNFWHYKYSGKADNTPSKEMKFGTLCHCLILEPDTFDSRYAVFTGVAPSSPNMVGFCDMVADGIPFEMAYNSNYKCSAKELGAKSLELYEKLCGYIEHLKESREKEAVTVEDLQRAQAVCENYANHPFLQRLNKLECFNEHVIMADWEFEGDSLQPLSCRAKIDKFAIDPENEIVYLPDLKTSFNSGYESFQDSFRKWGYGYQAAFYRQLVFRSRLLEILGIAHYSVRSYAVVLQSSEPFPVEVYRISEESLSECYSKMVPVIEELASLLSVSKEENHFKMAHNEQEEDGLWVL